MDDAALATGENLVIVSHEHYELKGRKNLDMVARLHLVAAYCGNTATF